MAIDPGKGSIPSHNLQQHEEEDREEAEGEDSEKKKQKSEHGGGGRLADRLATEQIKGRAALQTLWYFEEYANTMKLRRQKTLGRARAIHA